MAEHQYLVTYKGNGVWSDQDNQLWGAQDEPTRNIRHERAYKSDLGPDDFMEARPDFQFMVGYRSMTVDHVEVGEDNTQKVFTASDVQLEIQVEEIVEPKAAEIAQEVQAPTQETPAPAQAPVRRLI